MANYEEDKRLQEISDSKNAALNEVDQKYGEMIGGVGEKYDALIDASQQWADKQTQLQQEQTDFTIAQIEQQRQQAEKDYKREQSGAYVDWQKQSDQYGANAEAMAAQGMARTGYSESSQVAMYTAYQNRVATAREAMVQINLNYDNAIKEAKLQNSSALAEIAAQTYQKQLELTLEGFQYENSLIIDQMNKKQEIDNTYYGRYQDMLTQINNENALAEQIRQYNQDYELKMKQYEEGIRQFNEEIARLKANDAEANALKIQQLELEKQQLAEKQRQFDAQMAEEQRQFNASLSGGGGGGNDDLSIKNTVYPVPGGNSGNPVTYTPIAGNNGGGGGTFGGTKPTGNNAGQSGFTGSTYQEAYTYMVKNGVPTKVAMSVLTEKEWNEEKKKQNSTNRGTAAVANNDTYLDYLREQALYYASAYKK